MKLQNLKKVAQARAFQFEHSMTQFKREPFGLHRAFCTRCGLEAIVIPVSKDYPEGIIAGNAVHAFCKED